MRLAATLLTGTSIVLLSAACGVPLKEASRRPAIRFQEYASVQLPSGFRAVDAALLSGGRAIVVGFASAQVLIVDTSRRIIAVEEGALTSPIAAVFVSRDSSIEVIDTTPVAIQRFDSEGKAVERILVDVAGDRLIAATRPNSGWVFLLCRNASRCRLLWLDSDGQSVRSMDLPTSTLPNDRARMPFSITHDRESIVVAWRSRPFHLGRISHSSEAVHYFDAPTSVEAIATLVRPGATGSWLAMRPVVAGNKILQTLTNASADERINLSFDSTGHISSFSSVFAPVGVAAGSSEGDFLLAVRDVGEHELVWYRIADER